MKSARLLNSLFQLYLVGSVVLLSYAVLVFSGTSMDYKEMKYVELLEQRGEIGKIEFVQRYERIERRLQVKSMGKLAALLALGAFVWQAMATRKWGISRRGRYLGWVGAVCLAPLPLAIPILVLWSRPRVRSALEIEAIGHRSF